MWALLRRRKALPEAFLVDDGSFEVVAESFAPEVSDSVVLSAAERSGVDLNRALLIRHYVEVPIAAAAAALEQLAVEGYRTGAPASDTEQASGRVTRLRADRTVRASGLVVAQERARVTGLVARLGGDAQGWQLLAPPADIGD
jgi:hypothetical protein